MWNGYHFQYRIRVPVLKPYLKVSQENSDNKHVYNRLIYECPMYNGNYEIQNKLICFWIFVGILTITDLNFLFIRQNINRLKKRKI